jgi:hypothetical protein
MHRTALMTVGLGLLILSCSTPQPTKPAKVSAEQARHLVALYIGNHAWEIAFEPQKDIVKDGVLYYSVALKATGEAPDPRLLVSSETGDLYQPSLGAIEQTAAALLASEQASQEKKLEDFPADFVGNFFLDESDPLAGDLAIGPHSFVMGDSGSILKGDAENFTLDEQGILKFDLTGTLDEGQDESHTTVKGEWAVELSRDDAGVQLESLTGTASGLAAYVGKPFLTKADRATR